MNWRFLRYSSLLLCLLFFGCSRKRYIELDFLRFEMVPFDRLHDASDIRPFALATTELSYRLWYRVRLWAEAELGYQFMNPGAEGSEGKAAAAPRLAKPQLSKFRRAGRRVPKGDSPVSRISWGDALIWSNALTEYYNHLAQQKEASRVLRVVYRSLDGKILRSALKANAGEYSRSALADGFRLPSEREWELAAMDAKRRRQADLPAGAAYHSDREYNRAARYARNSDSRSWSSASRAPTKAGLYDMSGNLAEWVEDRFHADPENEPSLLLRTLKGGAYLSPILELQVGGRLPALPQQAHKSIGFRVARSMDCALD